MFLTAKDAKCAKLMNVPLGALRGLRVLRGKLGHHSCARCVLVLSHFDEAKIVVRGIEQEVVFIYRQLRHDSAIMASFPPAMSVSFCPRPSCVESVMPNTAQGSVLT
jgi:hypothetical protein